MSSIQPFGSELPSVSPWQSMAAQQLSPAGGAPGTGSASGADGAGSMSSVTMMSSFMQVSQVNQQVNAFLGTVGGNLQDNDMLRMMIAMLVLNALLGQTEGGKQSGKSGSAALDWLAALGQQQSVMLYESSYSSVHVDYQQSSYVQSSQSIPASGGSDGGEGPRLDTSA